MVTSYLLLSLITTSCLLQAILTEIDVSDYRIESDHLPDVRFRPPIGNGHVATNVLSDMLYMNGVFNGREDYSSRARIPAYVSIDVNTTTELNAKRKYIHDMYNGVFMQQIETSDFTVNVTYFAHRKFTRLLVTTVDVRRTSDAIENVTLTLSTTEGPESSDFIWNHQQNPVTDLTIDTMYHQGKVRDPEIPGSTPTVIHVYQTIVPETIVLSDSREIWSQTFTASLSQNKIEALNYFKMAQQNSGELLLKSHREAWHAVWAQGHIEVIGNSKLAADIAGAMYNILCSLPDKDDTVTEFFGLSPGGLSRGGLLVPDRPGGGHNDYAGHVFWDMDTWMLPPIMLFHPDMAKRMIGSRSRVLNQVKKNAEEAGYKGAKFPWEQATTGIEATPKWAGNTSFYQIHITSDVAYSLRQYLYATGDMNILTQNKGWELALEIARFWQSRVNLTDNNTAEILGVMGPDEYHWNIDNSVYTNYNAKLSLTLPGFIVKTFSIQVNSSVKAEIEMFDATANKILILFDERLQYHPQYQTFNLSDGFIKQSDVVLLGYPLMMPMSKQIRRNDLELYENVTNPEGPDTGTWSMHTVGWLELGDETRARKSFGMMRRNINEPFKVFSETPVNEHLNGGCVNFITAAGGLLQSIVFGYGGVRLRENQMNVNPYLLPETSSWRLAGIKYRGATFDLLVESSEATLTVTEKRDYATVNLRLADDFSRDLELNAPFKFKRQNASLTVVEGSTSSAIGREFKAYLLIVLFCYSISLYFWQV